MLIMRMHQLKVLCNRITAKAFTYKICNFLEVFPGTNIRTEFCSTKNTTKYFYHHRQTVPLVSTWNKRSCQNSSKLRLTTKQRNELRFGYNKPYCSPLILRVVEDQRRQMGRLFPTKIDIDTEKVSNQQFRSFSF